MSRRIYIVQPEGRRLKKTEFTTWGRERPGKSKREQGKRQKAVLGQFCSSLRGDFMHPLAQLRAGSG